MRGWLRYQQVFSLLEAEWLTFLGWLNLSLVLPILFALEWPFSKWTRVDVVCAWKVERHDVSCDVVVRLFLWRWGRFLCATQP